MQSTVPFKPLSIVQAQEDSPALDLRYIIRGEEKYLTDLNPSFISDKTKIIYFIRNRIKK